MNLQFATNDSYSLSARILAHSVDIAVVFEGAAAPHFTRRALFRQCLYLVSGKPVAGHDTSIDLAEVASLPLILPTYPNLLRDTVDDAFAAIDAAPNVTAEADVLYSILAAVRAGLGHTILPKGYFSDIPGHQTASALLILPAIHLTACVLSSADAPLNAAGQATHDLLVSFFKEYLRSNPAPGAEWLARTDESSSHEIGPIPSAYRLPVAADSTVPLHSRETIPR